MQELNAFFRRFKTSTLTYIRQNIKKIPLPESRLARAGIGTLSVAALASLGFKYYQRYQYNQYANTCRTKLHDCLKNAENFHDDVVIKLQASRIFKPIDKLYLMHEFKLKHLVKHQQTKTMISLQFKKYKRLEKEFEDVSSLQWTLNEQDQLSQVKIKKLLTLTDQRIEFATDVNNAQYHFKRNLHTLASDSIDRAIERLNKNDMLNLLSSYSLYNTAVMDRNYLFAHCYNIQAKIKRKQNDYIGSHQSYITALNYKKDDPILVGSQIALWGDIAWQDKDSLLFAEVKKLINDEAQITTLNNTFKTYGLGLANLSWLLLQASDDTDKNNNAEKLGLSRDKKNWCVRTAYQLADEAIPLIKNKSVNGLLFRGIAQMRLGKNDLALIDFEQGLKQENDHPSLLRRRAMALKANKHYKEAYWAYWDAYIELDYRAKHQPGYPKLYDSWLKEVKSDLQLIGKNLTNELLTVEAQQRKQSFELLINGNYEQAYLLLKTDKARLTNSINRNYLAWLERNFKIEQVQDNIHLSPKFDEDLYLRLNLYQHPTPYHFIKLSAAAYDAKTTLGVKTGSPNWEIMKINGQKGISYEVLADSQSSGYLAIACRNTLTGQVVISHAGTDIKELADIKTDIQLAWGNPYEQLDWAEKFTQLVLQELKKQYKQGRQLIKAGKPSDTLALPQFIYHTGHSLGGAIASYMACRLTQGSLLNKKILTHYAVTFDNPSPWWALDDLYHQALTKKLKLRQYRDFPIHAFLNPPSFINAAGGPHLGRIMAINKNVTPDPKPVSKLARHWLHEVVKSWVGNYLEEKTHLPTNTIIKQVEELFDNGKFASTLIYHDKERIEGAFKANEEGLYTDLGGTCYIEKWPADLEQWLNLRKIQPTSIADDQLSPEIYVDKSGYIASGQEVIPFSSMELWLENFLKKILIKNKNTQTLNDDSQKNYANYIDPYVLACMELDEKQDQIIIKGRLNSWQILTYLRQQAREASALQYIYEPLATFEQRNAGIQEAKAHDVHTQIKKQF